MGQCTLSPTGNAWDGVEQGRLTAAMGRQKADEHTDGGDGGPRLTMAMTAGLLEREGQYTLGCIVFRMVTKLLYDIANHPTIVVQGGLGNAALVSHPLTEGRQ